MLVARARGRRRASRADRRARARPDRAPGRSSGGGEVEIPPWFEEAARKMLEERGGVADDISLAELTLVTAAPSAQIAASSRGTQGHATAQVAPAAAASGWRQAEDRHREDRERCLSARFSILMDTARVRNGEPYL